MSDPQRRPGDHPRRAEPLQPDNPAQGLDAEKGSGDAGSKAAKSTHKAIEQEKSAVDNAREGYD